MGISFSTKALTLLSLKKIVKTANIAPIYILKKKDWIKKKQNCKDEILNYFKVNNLIVRSSCNEEDGLQKSNAGIFKTLLNVKKENLENSISEVFDSYRGKDIEEEVLIQPMLENVIRSGVCFSHDPNSGSPYRIINWEEGSDTTRVTSGKGGNIWIQSARSPLKTDKKFSTIIKLLDELLNIFEKKPIDVEFAITKDQKKEVLWLLQVRPLIVGLKNINDGENDLHNKLQIINEKLIFGMKEKPFLRGKKNLYGVMPDWNPAEIIGIRPKPLALSLYRELVTDSIWAYQRHNYGYRNLRSHPLMVNFFGLPYIDVRVSFNSFIPADLEDKLAAKLVDYYISRLEENPSLHDKVEFEILFSCYSFDLKKKIKSLSNYGFNELEKQTIIDSLLKLTNSIIHPKKGLWKNDAEKISILTNRRNNLLDSNLPIIEKIYWLIEDGKRYGTLPFAGLARTGFIAVELLRSLVREGIFSQKESDLFLKDIKTITGQLSSDFNILDKKSFLLKYGHLRPGTYDILTPRYDEDPDLYFDWSNIKKKPKHIEPFSISFSKMKEITNLINEHNLEIDIVSLFDFIQSGIRLREKSKFYFTKNLSDVLSLVKALGQTYKISSDEMAFCSINTIKNLALNADNIKETLLRDIEKGKINFENTKKILLPPLISKPDDVWQFQTPKTQPNFITLKIITAPVALSNDINNINGSIVCIPNADPGFDWLFSYDLAGLITAWGGANSHMAIRAFELELPAVIGVGDILYKRYSNAKRLFIDCSSKRIEVFH